MVEHALCNDGTSKAYLEEINLVSGSSLLRDKAKQAAKALDLQMMGVTAATVDALYRETEEQVQQWQSEGAHIINMESGSFYATSEVCGVSSIWLGFVSDCLVKESWDDWHVNLDEMAEITASICRMTVVTLFQKE